MDLLISKSPSESGAAPTIPTRLSTPAYDDPPYLAKHVTLCISLSAQDVTIVFIDFKTRRFMIMSAMSITALEILEQSEMPPTHARAIAKAIEADFVRRLDHLATKADLAELRADLKSEISDLRTEMAGVKGELRAEIRDVRAEIFDVKGELVRWIFLAVMGQTALFSGIMYFLLRITVPQ